MKKNLLFLILFSFGTILLMAVENPWGNVKKIYFYDSIQDYDHVRENLELIDFSQVTRKEQKKIAVRLIQYGDYYHEKGNSELAEKFYHKVLGLSPDYWFLYNKLEKIRRDRGGAFLSFKNMFSQLFILLKNFKASFVIVNHFLDILFFSGMGVFFLFTFLLFLRYFRLAGNDLILDKEGKFSLKKALIVVAVLLWPLLLMTGWMIYPFIISGFLWLYIDENEKKAIKFILIMVAVLSMFYSLNLVMEHNIRTKAFEMAEKVYAGHRFEKNLYDSFDDQLKVPLAYSYYENGEYDKALDILTSTGEDFQQVAKSNLMGNIYYKFGEISQSMKYYQDSLKLDDKNDVALNNFTLVLIKNQNPTVFNEWAGRYAEIEAMRTQVSTIKDVKISQGDLWRRLLNVSGKSFSLVGLLKILFAKLLTLPVFYYILIFLGYIFGLKKITPTLGESTHCSKCSRIIKEASVHRSYKLCDECYQLFSIKDVIFLEAKILKEKELRKKFRKKYSLALLFSLFIPGLGFVQTANNRVFLTLSITFYFLLGFAIFGTVIFQQVFMTAPLFFSFLGMCALVVYLLVNIISVIGDEDGF